VGAPGKRIGTSWLGLEWGQQARHGSRGTLSRGDAPARKRAAWVWLAVGAAIVLAAALYGAAHGSGQPAHQPAAQAASSGCVLQSSDMEVTSVHAGTCPELEQALAAYGGVWASADHAIPPGGYAPGTSDPLVVSCSLSQGQAQITVLYARGTYDLGICNGLQQQGWTS
jgi:hypothetical protein